MSTTNTNNLKFGVVNGLGEMQVQVPIDPVNFPFNQGDLLFWDGTNHLAKPVTADADCATLLGCAKSPSAVSSSLDVSSAPKEKVVQAGFLGIYMMKTTAAQTYYTGTKLYVGADAQTITTVAGTNAVGVAMLPYGQTSVTGASGVSIPVLVYHKAFLPLQA